MLNSPLLEAKNVSFSYGKDKVLRDVSLVVNRGEYLSIVGMNGSGKTTLLSLLSGHLRPDKGAVFLNGRNLNSISVRERARQIALVSQSRQMNFPFTCLELVLMGLHPHSERFENVSDEQLEKAREIMESTDVWRFADKPITEISGGERQRVILSRALMQNPSLLLLDEAVSELDIAAKISMMKLLLQQVRKTGMSVVSIHHDLTTVFRFSDRVAALKLGSLAENGTPEKLMTKEFFKDVFSVDAEILSNKGFIVCDNI